MGGEKPQVLGAWLLLPLCAGLALRLLNLRAQVLGDDEVLLIRIALNDPLREILVTYHLADSCIPLTALFHLLVAGGFRLSETMLRLPGLASGTLLIALLPWAIARRLGRRPALILAWLLAVSPSLVFYSRIARSYMPTMLLATGAVIAFEVWWREPSVRAGAAYIALASLAAWFHPVAAPFVLAPFLFAAGDLFARTERGRRARALLVLGLLTLAGFLAFMLPARSSLWQMIQAKHRNPGGLSRTEIYCVLELLAGSGHVFTAALFWIAAVAGLVCLFRRASRFAGYTLALAVAFVAALLLLAPAAYQYPVVLHRYLLLGLPIVLVWLAFGLAAAGQAAVSARGSAVWRIVVPMAVLAFLSLTGPLAEPRRWRSPFMHQEPYLVYCMPTRAETGAEVPEFYHTLGRSLTPAPVIEYPWLPLWEINRAFDFYQQIHRQDVVVSTPRPSLWDERLAFRNMVNPDTYSFLQSRARYLVVHRDLGHEELSQVPLAERGDELAARLEAELHVEALTLARRLKREWGPPDYADGLLQVWDLDRLRAEPSP